MIIIDYYHYYRHYYHCNRRAPSSLFCVRFSFFDSPRVDFARAALPLLNFFPSTHPRCQCFRAFYVRSSSFYVRSSSFGIVLHGRTTALKTSRQTSCVDVHDSPPGWIHSVMGVLKWRERHGSRHSQSSHHIKGLQVRLEVRSIERLHYTARARTIAPEVTTNPLWVGSMASSGPSRCDQ